MEFLLTQLQHRLFGHSVRTFRTVFLAVAAFHLLYFVMLPWLLTRRKTHSPRLRRYLEWVVATPSLLGDSIRAEARSNLMRLALMEGRHEQVAEQGFALVRHRHLPAGMIVEARGRLADALEGLGRHEEAREQRRLAESGLKDAPRNPAWYVHRGRQLAAARDFAGACRAYEDGLKIAPPGPGDERALLTLSLANALFMAGRVEESADRAEEAVGLVHDPERLYSAHRQAGASLATIGRLDESEEHRRRAAELASASGDPVRIVDSLGDLAEVRRKRGQLVEALAACDQATASGRPTRHLELIRYETHRSLGNFDEALAANLRASKIDPNGTPRAEQMMQAILAYGRATVLMELGHLDRVPPLLHVARSGVRGDEKLTLWCDSAQTRLDALLGRRDVTLAAMERIEARLEDFAQDKNTQAVFLSNLGRAALALEAYGRALHHWDGYLALPPQPVDVPIAHYHRGEAHRGLGEVAAARACYQTAVQTGLETHYVRLARSRLRSILP